MSVDHGPQQRPAMELPLWLRQRARSSKLLSGKSRLLAMAAVCITLGYLLAASFSYGSALTAETSKNVPAPSHSFMAGSKSWAADADIYTGSNKTGDGNRGPSIKGALSDLGRAVGSRISDVAATLHRPLSPFGTGKNVSRPGIFSSYQRHNISASLDQCYGIVSEQVMASRKDMLGARQRIGKVTIIFGTAPIYERAVRTHEAHDALHNYPLFVLRHGMMDDVWSKPAYILSLLLRELARPEDDRLQWLLWVDADTILLNPHVPIDVFLPPSPEFDDIHMLVTTDQNGLNNGVFPIRVNQWSADLFAAIVSWRHYQPNVPLQFRDQTAMEKLLDDSRFSKHVTWVPQDWFNAYHFQVHSGDFLVHFAGVGDRAERMAKWLERAEQHLPDWEIAVEHTRYPTQVREFWVAQREKRTAKAKQLSDTRTQAEDLMRVTKEQLSEYRDSVGEADEVNISARLAELGGVILGENLEYESIKMAMEKLGSARTALDKLALDAHKKLIKEAHEAIFAAEKTLLQVGSDEARDQGEPKRLEEATGSLKMLALMPAPAKDELDQAIADVRRLGGVVEAEVQKNRKPEPESEPKSEPKVEGGGAATSSSSSSSSGDDSPSLSEGPHSTTTTEEKEKEEREGEKVKAIGEMPVASEGI